MILTIHERKKEVRKMSEMNNTLREAIELLEEKEKTGEANSMILYVGNAKKCSVSFKGSAIDVAVGLRELILELASKDHRLVMGIIIDALKNMVPHYDVVVVDDDEN